MDTEHTAITEPVRRLEVFTGAWRRRIWRPEDKVRIVDEIATSGDPVCAVARRHGLSPQQLFGWRRQLQDAETERSEADGLQFVPAVVDAGSSSVPQGRALRGKALQFSQCTIGIGERLKHRDRFESDLRRQFETGVAWGLT